MLFRLISLLVTVGIMAVLWLVMMRPFAPDCDPGRPAVTTTTIVDISLPPAVARSLERTAGATCT